MTTKTEMEAQWADLSRLLGTDPKLAKVLDSLDNTLKATGDDEPRQRLKVPYASAVPIGNGSDWN